MSDPVAIILAAGKGTRMNSDLPKVMHAVCGRPMVEHVLDAARAAGVKRIVVVVGHKAELLQEALSRHADVEFALQSEQKGTGHAVIMCANQLANHDGPTLVLAGDTPLLRGESLAGLLTELREHRAACVIGTAITENNFGLGRVVRSPSGEFLRIVEQKDTTPVEAAIREINTGCYAFDSRLFFQALAKIRPNNSQAEYYLTDCPAILKSEGHIVVAAPRLTIEEAMGVNTPQQLAEVEQVLRQRSQTPDGVASC
ncbi:MAG TPA: NTP transferase domain-containing protein [Planctomycetaceae bacterium]|nr:NTP transferase domain-containing protein [Planctomycetaceae bacterium]